MIVRILHPLQFLRIRKHLHSAHVEYGQTPNYQPQGEHQ